MGKILYLVRNILPWILFILIIIILMCYSSLMNILGMDKYCVLLALFVVSFIYIIT